MKSVGLFHRKWIYTLLFLTLTLLHATGEIAHNRTIPLERGLVLRYIIENLGNRHELIVTVLNCDTALTFSFKLTNKRHTTGKITMTKNAVRNAIAQYNYFQNNEITLNNQTAVWISKKVWRKLKILKKCNITTNSGEMLPKSLEFIDLQNFTILKNGSQTTLKAMYCIIKESNGSRYWILDNPNNPLILRMELNFTIELKEVRTIKRRET